MNMKNHGMRLLVMAGLGCLLVAPAVAGGQRNGRRQERQVRRPYRRYDNPTIARLVDRVEEMSNAFRHDYERALSNGMLPGTERNDNLKEHIQRMDEALERLRANYDRKSDWRDNRSLVSDVLQSARPVDRVMRNRVRIASVVRGRWDRLRSGLNELAGIFGLSRLR